MKELTGSLPLVLVHFALAVLVDDAHPLEQVGKLWLVLFVRVQVVELALIERVERVGRCQAVSWSANGVWREREWVSFNFKSTLRPEGAETDLSKFSQSTKYSGTSSTAS